MLKLHFLVHSKFFLMFAIISSSTISAETEPDPVHSKFLIEHSLSSLGLPDFQLTFHKRSNLKVTKTNYGLVGSGKLPGFIVDVFTGQEGWVGSEFPAGSQISHFQNYLVFGAIVNGDTLVSSGFSVKQELNPDESPYGDILHRSNLDLESPEYIGAVSEEDYISVYTDTFKTSQLFQWVGWDYFGRRPHKPLNIRVTEKSYAWSLAYAQDFVIYEMIIENIGDDQLGQFYFGIAICPKNGWVFNESLSIANDDISGFIERYPASDQCDLFDTLNMAWSADNDGDPYNGKFVTGFVPYKSARSVTGVNFITLPRPTVKYSFNWWMKVHNNIESDFGPRHRLNFRDFRTGGIGWPYGDVNEYHILSNGEIDYDIPYINDIRQYDPTWLYPNREVAVEIMDGHQHFGMLSVGPFHIPPGGSIPLRFVISAGENFHTDPRNLKNLYGGDTDAYYANLDFSDLIKNAQWARWIYDNPGIDTDNDGYAGEFRVCVFDSVLDANNNWIATVAETTWYKGDGVPDWRAALPPPTPKMWVTPTFKGIKVRFNGQESETTPDIFTKLLDFEGYRIYLARDDRETSYSLLASYDIENYDKFIWNYEKQPEPGWELLDFPMTLQEIRCSYGLSCDDSLFDFLKFRPSLPYSPRNFPESLFYFVKHEHNVSEFGVTTPITKRFPNAPDPRGKPADSITADFYTADGYLKFFEYEFTIENIIPTVAYYVSVTAMDFGWPKSGLEPLETSITENAQQIYANIVDPALGEDSLQIVVYPNPYRIDANYRARGFEGLNQDDRWSERLRRIHFANIPPKCTISIFSLDGDLIREIHHDKDPSDPTSRHAEWGLISRNGLRVVSGLYYWVVESDSRTEMGKLVIIL